MKLKVSLLDPNAGPVHDLLVTIDTTVSVGGLADAIGACQPTWRPLLRGAQPALREAGGDLALPRDITVADSGIRSGSTLAWVPEAKLVSGPRVEPPAVLVVVDGPQTGEQFPLRVGANEVGRDRGNDVRLSDPLVSKSHLRVNVGDVVEVIDLGSANGTEVGGHTVDRTVLRDDDQVRIGNTVVRVVRERQRSGARPGGGAVTFNRSPRLRPIFKGRELPGPDVPERPQRAKLPMIPLLAPALVGAILFAVTRQLVSVLFLALSPVMMLGNVLENRRSADRQYQAQLRQFHDELAGLDDNLGSLAVQECQARVAEQPGVEDIVVAATGHGPLLWSTRPGRPGYLELRLGVAALPSRTKVAVPSGASGMVTLRNELRAVLERHSMVGPVPYVLALSDHSAVGVAGPSSSCLAMARALVAQLVGLHSPAELVLAAVVPASASGAWEWLKWLPHVNSEHSPLSVQQLAANPAEAIALLTALEEELDHRASAGGKARQSKHNDGDKSTIVAEPLPTIVLLVDDDAPAERSRLVELAERGGPLGLHVLWTAASVERLPISCSLFLVQEAGAGATTFVGEVDLGQMVPIVPESLAADRAMSLAMSLAPVVDSGAGVDDETDLPPQTSLPTLIGSDTLLADGSAILDRWRTSGSLPPETGARPRRKAGSLRGVVGVAADRRLVLDLREHGPHALVGGTTGSGKSEFLQSWVMAMATEHSPHRLTFLFVDYKGGAAFGECRRLPHSVGCVTDLNPHLVDRVLTSLHAELRYREKALRERHAKDLLELESRGDPAAPPSLVIVVDEFAALVAEVPEFVDGVVNIAQRGRSLGLHLILATQRPAGVIRDNIRANTNLRIALRMADADDSTDVVGSPVAAAFDPKLPGRGVAKLGPGRLTMFQAGYVGGRTPERPLPPPIVIETLVFGGSRPWAADGEDLLGAQVGPEAGPSDLGRLLVATIAAQERAALPAPRRPWLEPLAEVYDLARLTPTRTDKQLFFAASDEPEAQSQGSAAFCPDEDGNMAVFGTGGAGKSACLRTLAVAAGLTMRGGPCHVYGLDFAGRGLQMLEAFDHVGAIINGDDDERVVRLLRALRTQIDDRAVRYSAVNAGSIDDYRVRAGHPEEPRVLVLVDGMASFRQAYELGSGRWFEAFLLLAAEGRPVGVHFVVSADRAAALPAALNSVVQRRLVMRMANESDYFELGAPANGFAGSAPPGRGFLDKTEVQVAVLGGTANTADQASAIQSLARQLRQSTKRCPAPAIGRLPELVSLSDLPTDVDGRPALGIADGNLAPVGFAPDVPFLVVGPPRSGRTSVLAALAASLKRWRPEILLVHLSLVPSPLGDLLPWTATATGNEDVLTAVASLRTEIELLTAAGAPHVALVVEGLLGFANTPVEAPMVELFKAAGSHGVTLLAEIETSIATSWSQLSQPIRSARHGLALQPDQVDGESVFKTAFPRLARRDFPPGRGMYVAGGRAAKVQVALAEGGLSDG